MNGCGTCDGLGAVACDCGGDFCACGIEEIDCPDCDGVGIDDDEDGFGQAAEGAV